MRTTTQAAMQADVERLMARLMTDPALRERFVADPAAVARDSGLSPPESEAIAKIPVADLHTAARSYAFKRDAKRGPLHPVLAWWRARLR